MTPPTLLLGRLYRSPVVEGATEAGGLEFQVVLYTVSNESNLNKQKSRDRGYCRETSFPGDVCASSPAGPPLRFGEIEPWGSTIAAQPFVEKDRSLANPKLELPCYHEAR